MKLNTIQLIDCREGIKNLPDNSIDCCVTSPPYYGLRDYGTATWEGGDPDCTHIVSREKGFEKTKQSTNRGTCRLSGNVCGICGAIRVDKQIGLEESPELYIRQLVELFNDVYRVLKPSGTLWIVIGDSYWGGKGYSGSSAGIYQYQRRKEGKSFTHEYSNFGGKGTIRPTDRKHESIKKKDLIGIPWMLALALRDAGWYLRQDIIWHKTNPMPESVTDRCTRAHEYIFLLTKSANYYFDNKAILEPTTRDGNNRNKRDVWSICTNAGNEDHFATFPEMLIVDCIRAGCPEDGIVLDPFMGSGTTAVVARKLYRNFIGFELNRDYVNIANRKLTNKLGLFI